MKKEISNKPASVLAKLQNIARSENVDSNSILLRYCQERFLYRLSVSEYSNSFCLKGGLLLICFDIPATRPTKDIDFLVKEISNNVIELEKVVSKITSLNCDDGISFVTNAITSEEIIEDGNHPGIRVKIPAFIGKARTTIQLDFAWGDIVKPAEVMIDFPTIIDNELVPRLKAYSVESAVSEKFEAAVDIGITNSRMKDFYDIYVLCLSQNFKADLLKEAIEATFKNRETTLSDDLYIFGSEFTKDETRQKQWDAFLHKHKLKNVPRDFAEVMARNIALLKPLVISILDNKEINSSWDVSKGIWKE